MHSVFYLLINPGSSFVPLEWLLTFLVFQYVFMQKNISLRAIKNDHFQVLQKENKVCLYYRRSNLIFIDYLCLGIVLNAWHIGDFSILPRLILKMIV